MTINAARNVGEQPQTWSLRTRAVVDGTNLVLELEGRLGHKTAPLFEEAARKHLSPDVRGVVLDLSAVGYLSSPALRVIERLSQELTARGGTLALRSPSAPVRIALRLAGVDLHCD